MIHYLIRCILAVCGFLANIKTRRRCGSRFEAVDDGNVSIDGIEGVSTELHHPAINGDSHPGSFATRGEIDTVDDDGLGNILINASIG